MKLSLLTLPLAALLALQPATACGPFFKATLLAPDVKTGLVLAAPVADVLAEILTAPGAPQLAEDGEGKDPGTPASLPAGLTISEEGLTKSAWAVLQRDVTDLSAALGAVEGRMGLLAAYAQVRREGLLRLTGELLETAPSAAGEIVMPVWPKGLPEEFRWYGEGAAHFQQGRLKEAQTAWEKVLALPVEQRKFRSTWAAWMLGRTAFRTDPAAAVAWFRRIRVEARTGHDSLGRALVSPGWEALAEEKLMALEPDGFSVARAERLVWLLARHAQAGGGEPYYLSGRHFATLQELPVRRITELAQGWMNQPAEAAACAASPFLRQVLTACLLPIGRPYAWSEAEELPPPEASPASRWFSALDKADGGGSDALADRLAWAAYEAGNYPLAASWLKRAKDSPMTHWLRAKQFLQTGKLAEAAQELETARPGFELSQPQADRHEDCEGHAENALALQREQFQADVGLVRLALDDFPGSLDALSRSGFWEDAAYVLENVVTADEAVSYAVKWPLEPGFKGGTDPLPERPTVENLTAWLERKPEGETAPLAGTETEKETDFRDAAPLHYAIARRLAREDRTKVSREFLPVRLRPVLDLFLKHRAVGQNKDLPKAARAEGYWKAALIHRYFGMELWGFEGFPDNAKEGGAFDAENVRGFRLGLVNPNVVPDPDARPKVIFPSVSAAEKERLTRQAAKPGKRFNYRYHAYGLAKQAFDLMPDNSDELAARINLTGWWFVKFDEEAARRCFDELQRRCPKTALAQLAKTKDRVVPMEPAAEAAIKRLD